MTGNSKVDTKQCVLLTGATGFLGSHLLEALLREQYQVVILKRSTSDTWRIKHLLGQVKSYDVDKDPIARAFEHQRIDVVIHTACHYGRNNDPINQIVESNLMFGLQILDVCIQFKTDTFFNTDTLLQKYLNTYTLSKKQFIEWLNARSNEIQVINMKLEHMYGPKDDTTKFVPWVLSQLKQHVPQIRLTKGEQQRDFIYINDVVSAYLTVLARASDLADFEEFDVGTGQLVTVRTFLEQMKLSYEAKFGATGTKLDFGVLPYRKGEMMTIEVDNNPIKSLGWDVAFTGTKGIGTYIEEIQE
jgi:nucleoside-diphosphate-sugar epimerase